MTRAMYRVPRVYIVYVYCSMIQLGGAGEADRGCIYCILYTVYCILCVVRSGPTVKVRRKGSATVEWANPWVGILNR